MQARHCEFTLCIYNEDWACTTAEVPAVDALGMCSGCIIPTIPEDYLRRCKQELLEQLENERQERR